MNERELNDANRLLSKVENELFDAWDNLLGCRRRVGLLRFCVGRPSKELETAARDMLKACQRLSALIEHGGASPAWKKGALNTLRGAEASLLRLWQDYPSLRNVV
jgi:hypothetical protein